MLNFVIYLGLTILLLVLFGNYMNQRIEDQNHKIVTLASILTTLTTEIQILRSSSQPTTTATTTASTTEIGPSYKKSSPEQTPESFYQASQDILRPHFSFGSSSSGNIELVIVSDDENDDNDDDDENNLEIIDSNNDDDNDDDNDNDNDDDDEDDDDENNDDKANQLLLCMTNDFNNNNCDNNHFKIIDFMAAAMNSMDPYENSLICSIECNQFPFKKTHSTHSKNIIEEVEELTDSNNNNLLEIENENDEENVENENQNVAEKENSKPTKEIEIEVVEKEYKKMTVEQLRKLVVEKQLSLKPSKLKKNELLNLLSEANNLQA